ncbi:cysteine proteinase, partial [Clavulina sp. PMI_390]
MIEALSAPARDGSSKSLLFSSREHQDAQELFQLLSSLIKDEATAVDKDAEQAFVGLGIALSHVKGKLDEVGKGMFDGLTANRRSCVVCGYTEAVMHFGFDNVQLSLPFAGKVSLEDVLHEMTKIEVLTDCMCRKCSLVATERRLEEEIQRLTSEEPSSADTPVSQSRKKRIKETKKLQSRVAALIKEGRIEEDVKGLKIERTLSRASTKQVMLARAPPVLVLHLNRSSFWGHSASKNTTAVVYPELLDLTPFTTSGQLSTSPSAPISSTAPPPSVLSHLAKSSSSSSQSSSSPASPRVYYILQAIVCHYGGHGFGHYICYRRKPRPIVSSSSQPRFRPPTLQDLSDPASGKGWLRISDDSVGEVGINTVLGDQSGVFLLFYERVAHQE